MYKIYISILLAILIIVSYFLYSLYNKEAFSNIPESTPELKDVYVISLTDSVFLKAKDNLSPYFPPKIAPIQKFDAIKGSSLITFDPKLISIGGYRSVLYDENRKTHADLGSMNAVGCALSHSSLWRMVKKGSGMYIFESDAICDENPMPYVEEFLKTKNPHMLLFGTIGRSKDITKSGIRKVNHRFYGLHGYYITYEGAQLLLKYMFPIEQQVDSYISDLLLLDTVNNPFVHFGLNVYIISPGICYQYNQDGTSIQTKIVV